MATVDSLDIQISAETKKASASLDKLVSKLDTLATSLNKINASQILNEFAKLSKSMSGINGNIFKSFTESAKAAETSMNKLTKEASKGIKAKATFDISDYQNATTELSKKFADVGKNIEFSGNLSQLEKQYQSLEKVFDKLAEKERKIISVGVTSPESSIFKNLQYDISFTLNQLDTLSKEMKKLEPLNLEINVSGENKTPPKFLIEYKKEIQDFKNEMDILKNTYDNFQNIPKGGVNALIENLKESVFELKDAYPHATNVISQYEEELAKLKNISKENKILEFTEKLNQLQIPQINTTNLKALQNDLSKTELKLEELRIKLENDLNMGHITKSVDDKGFVRLQEQIKKTELRTEALKDKIKEVGDESSQTGGISNLSPFLEKAAQGFSKIELNGKKLPSVFSTIEKSSSKVTNAIGRMGLSFKNLLKSILPIAGIAGIFKFGKEAIETASKLTEVQNVVSVTFSSMAYKVEEFAKTSIEQFGMSELALKEYSSRFQAMGTAMGINSGLIKNANSFLEQQTNGYVEASGSMADMSLNLTKLTADMASFYNVEQEDVAKNLQSIFTGETEPLRKYGLDLTQATLAEWALKQGLDADVQSMSQAEKTMLRYQYVMANTTAAQNDFSKTADSWANQTRILKQNFEQLASVIGGALINAFKPFVQTLNIVLKQVISFAKIVTEALGAIFGWKYEVSSGGMVSDWGDIEDSTGGVADNLGDASKSVEKMNKSIRAWDELNVLTTNEPSKGSGGGGGLGGAGAGLDADGSFGKIVPTESILKDYESFIDNLYDLGSYISETLEDALGKINWDNIYKKAEGFGSGLASFLNGLIKPGLFDELGDTVAGALNTALHFLDSFGEKFDWENFGSSLSSGLVSFLRGIQWETALSAASNWGKGIGTALNSFISEETFSEVGNAVAMALNTAIQFALDLGHTFNFENLGNSIAAGINEFFNKLDSKKLAKTINVWIKGALKTVSTLLRKTDFEMIGKKIGTFLSELDILSMMGRFAQMLWEAIKAGLSLLSGLIQEAPFETALIAAFAAFKFLKVGSIIASGISSALVSNLATKLGVDLIADSSISSVLSTALSKKLDLPLKNLSDKIAMIAPAVGVAVGGFVELNVVSGAIENLITGTGNFIIEIGKIAGAVGLAGKAMTTILGFPAGVVATAIAGIIGAIKGINEAFDEIHAENVGNAINNALTNPGGTSIDEIFTNFTDNMKKIEDSFSQISEKSSALDSAKQNIQDTVFEIDKIKTSLDAGVMTAEEAIPKLTNLYGQLADAIMTKIGAAGDVLLATFADDSISAKAFESGGIKAEEMRERVVQSMSEQEKAVYDLKTELENLRSTDPTNPRIPELEAQMISMASGLGEADKALEELRLGTEKGLNWEEYLNQEGLDTGRLHSALEDITNSVIDTRKTAETEFNAAILAAKEMGDEENYNDLKSALPSALNYMDSLTAEEALKLVNTLQEDAIGGINKVVEEAQENWEKMKWHERLFSGFSNESEYITNYVNQFKTNTIDPLSSEIEGMMSQLGIDGAGWSANAVNTIMDGMWEYDTTTREIKLSNSFSSLVQNAINSSEKNLSGTMNEFGNNIVLGIVEGIQEGDTETIGNKMLDMVNFARGIMGIHSPSTVMEEIGGYMMEGLSNGISEMIDSVMQKFTDIKDKILESWDEAKQETEEVWGTISGKVSDTWDNIKTWAEEKFNATKESIGTAWDNTKEKTNTVWNEVSGKVSGTWNDMKTGASDKFGDIKKSITDSWEDINTSTKRIWDQIKNAVKTPINAIIGFINGMLSGIGDGVNGVINILNKLKINIPKTPFTDAVSIGFDIPNITVPQIPRLAKGGLTLQHTFAEIGELNRPEAVLPLTNRRTMGMIADSILSNSSGTQYETGDFSGIQDEIRSASSTEAQLLREQNQLLRQLLNKEFGISENDIGRAAQSYSRKYYRRTGKPAYDY